MLIAGGGRLGAFGIVVYKSGFSCIGVGGNAGLADEAELPDENISGLMVSCESPPFVYTGLSDITSLQSQNMASSDGLQGVFSLCAENDLGSEKYA
jgi:hypothetical protein